MEFGLATLDSLDDDFIHKLSHIRRELLDEYRRPHGHPWIIGYSGGKDSTVVVHLVFEMLLDYFPSCDASSSRFGCWTCTVVVKDRSLEGFVDAGFAEFGPLLEFRNWLAEIRDQDGRRSNRRRNGEVTHLRMGELVLYHRDPPRDSRPPGHLR